MTFFHVIILGIVEGITEFLPISSTGHLILTARILGLTHTDFLASFEVAIQVGAILSVIVLYGRSLILDRDIIKRVLVAFIPTAIIGLILYKIIKKYLLGNELVVVWSLLLGGLVIIIFEIFYKEKENAVKDVKDMTFVQAACIGLFQSLAVIPGVSRAAATIIGGLSLGLNRKTIVEFSFLLAIPTMFAATGMDLMKSAAGFNMTQVIFLLVGCAVSFVIALVAIKFLLHFVKNNNFIVFGVYRIIIAIIFLMGL